MPYLKRHRATVTSQTSDSPILTTPAVGTPASGVGTNLTSFPAAQASGVMSSDVTGGSGIDALGTVTSGTFEGTLDTSTTFPAERVIKVYHSHDTTSDIRSSTSYSTNGNNIVLTPTSVNSRFSFIFDGNGYYESGFDMGVYLAMFRHISANSTTAPARGSASQLSLGDGGNTLDLAYWAGFGSYVDIGFQFGFVGIDDPDTTAQIGYYIESVVNGGTYRFPQGASHLTILEINQ
jgi:hypothetical protein